MDYPLCFRTLYAICIDMRHNVVADNFFSLFGHVVVDIIRMAFQFFNLLICNIETQLFLSLSQCDPQSSPCAELFIW